MSESYFLITENGHGDKGCSDVRKNCGPSFQCIECKKLFNIEDGDIVIDCLSNKEEFICD